MSFHIVDNKKVDMTNDEWLMYTRIVKSYSVPPNNGEDLFIDLFEVDSNGIILFLKPPSKRQSSMEVFMFLMSLQQNQHIRLMYDQVDHICKQLKVKMEQIDQKLGKLECKD